MLRAHPAVADALVVGRASERWGEELVALVALRPTDADVDRELAARALHGASGAVQGAQGVHLRRPRPPPRQRQGGLPLGEKSSGATGVADMTHKAIDCLVNVHFGETEKQPDLDAQGARRLLQGSGVDVRPGRPVRAARRDGRARRRKGHPDGQPREAFGHRTQVRRGSDPTGSRWRWAESICSADARHCASSAPLSATCRWRMPLWGPASGVTAMYPPSDAVYYPLYTKCAETRTAAVHQHRPARPADSR